MLWRFSWTSQIIDEYLEQVCLSTIQSIAMRSYADTTPKGSLRYVGFIIRIRNKKNLLARNRKTSHIRQCLC